MASRFWNTNCQIFARIYDRGILRTALVFIPIGLCIENSFFSTYRVHGNSMEPALQDADIVFVRKVDFFPSQNSTSTLSKSNDDNDKEDSNHAKNSEQNYEDLDRVNISRMDALIGSRSNNGVLWSPCQAMKGDIILYKSPHHFHPQQVHIKRVIGLGGQRVRPADSFRNVKAIHPYSVWVEGDNISENEEDGSNSNHYSDDSRKIGPICKKLIVGKAVHIIWPPSRWGPIKRSRPPLGRSWWS